MSFDSVCHPHGAMYERVLLIIIHTTHLPEDVFCFLSGGHWHTWSPVAPRTHTDLSGQVQCSGLWVIDKGANEATNMLHVKGIDTIQTPENPL